jgi:hypothetical protein
MGLLLFECGEMAVREKRRFMMYCLTVVSQDEMYGQVQTPLSAGL